MKKKKGLKRFFFGEILLFYAYVNTFVPNVPFLYPLKTLETIRFSDVFRGYRKGALGTNGLRLGSATIIIPSF